MNPLLLQFSPESFCLAASVFPEMILLCLKNKITPVHPRTFLNHPSKQRSSRYPSVTCPSIPFPRNFSQLSPLCTGLLNRSSEGIHTHNSNKQIHQLRNHRFPFFRYLKWQAFLCTIWFSIRRTSRQPSQFLPVFLPRH